MALWSSFEAKVVVAFAASTVVVASLATLTWKVADDAAKTALLVADTHEVLNNLARTRGYSLQIELATQNFRLTGNENFLVERNEAASDREETLDNIQTLTADNPHQQRRWADLREVFNQRMAIAQHVERLRTTQGPEAAIAYLATAPLQATRARAYELLGEMDAAARQRLLLREAAHDDARRSLVLASALMAATLTLLLCTTHWLIRRQLRTTEATRRALADSEESLATTLHSIGDAVLATDVDGRVIRMNPVAERLTGWPASQAIGRPIEEVFRIIHEETRAPAEIPVAKVLASGEAHDLADLTSLIARDGSECAIADSAAPIRDAQGEVRGVVLVFRDVSVQRQAERIIREQNVSLAADVRERTAQWRESESHLQAVIGAVPALIAYVNRDRRYVYVNEQYRENFAPGRSDITGCTVREILGEERYAISGPLIDKVLAGEAQSYDRHYPPDGWQTIHLVPKREANGDITGYYVLGIDVTERKHSEERIQALNAELAQRVRELEHASRALRTLSAGNRTMLRASEEQHLLESMCRAIVTAGGYAMAVVWYRGDTPDGALHPMAECNFPGGLEALRQLRLTTHDDALGQSVTPTAVRLGEVRLARNMRLKAVPATGSKLTRLTSTVTTGLACPLRVDGEVIGALSIFDPTPGTFDEDEITLLTESADDLAFGIATLRSRAQRERVQSAMHHMLRHDALTGLPNAIQFTEALSAAVEGPSASHQNLAALQLNIDRLGEINDALGFAHGDQLLRDFGQRLRESVPSSAVVARLRGDEFAVLAPCQDDKEALALAEELEANLSRPFSVADIELDVSAKTGIALYTGEVTTAATLLRQMGRALSQAKARSLSRCVYEPSRQADRTGRLTMAGDLRRAISGNQLRLYLQPKVEFESGRICGAEALVRWQHPQRGLVPPALFIGLAEQTGLIKPLTEWVVVAALDVLRDWLADGEAIPIAINFSARNFRDEQLFDKFRHWRTQRGIAPGLLEIELTESTVMEDAEYALRVLRTLRAEGTPLYVDDFGTGYSSLSYLQKLPVDSVKIDKSFVAAMPHDRDSAMIVRSTIDLMHDLGCRTVAEGVETREHWEMLSTLGCDVAQGYFIARPMPAHEFRRWVAQFNPPEPTSQTLWPDL